MTSSRARVVVSASMVAGALAASLCAVGVASASPSLQGGGGSCADPQVIGHRGASGYRPEHTLAAYELAARLGADVIEPDVVSTKDGHLVVRHEPEISGTTDVASRPEFADRKTTKSVDGHEVTGWFTTDFTLEELRTLRAVERLPQVRQHNTIYNGRWGVPTLDEVLTLRTKLSRELRREIGVIPELKHSTFHAEAGVPMEETYVRLVSRHGLNHRRAPLTTQSFELTNLKTLRDELGYRAGSVFLVDTQGGPFDLNKDGQNVTYAELITAESLEELSEWITSVGPYKLAVIPVDEDGQLGEPTSLVEDAHAAGLTVTPWTFRAENAHLPAQFKDGDNPTDFGHSMQEMKAYFEAGIDGFFTDHPDVGVAAVEDFQRQRGCTR